MKNVVESDKAKQEKPQKPSHPVSTLEGDIRGFSLSIGGGIGNGPRQDVGH